MRPMNIGDPNEFTMLELSEQVVELTGSKSKIVHLELPRDEPKQRKPDVPLAKRELDWEPKTQLREGLLKMIQHFETELSAK